MSNRISISGAIAGINLRGSFVSAGVNVQGSQASLGTPKTGNLTTRTSDTVGELTMDASHGITTGAIIDLYWEVSAGVWAYRHGVVVGTVSVNAVPFSLGAGTVLPADEFEILAMVQTVVPCELPAFTSAAANMLVVATCDQAGVLRFRTAADESGTEIVYDLKANEPFVLHSPAHTQAAMLTTIGAVESMTITHRGAGGTATFKWGASFD